MPNSMKYQRYKELCCQCGRQAPNCACLPINPSWAGYPMQLQQTWQANYLKSSGTKLCRFDRATIKRVMPLVRAGYLQSSRKYRRLSKQESWHVRETAITLSEDDFACFRRIYRTIWHYRHLAWREEKRLGIVPKVRLD
jgi:hypothetical protein